MSEISILHFFCQHEINDIYLFLILYHITILNNYHYTIIYYRYLVITEFKNP